MSLKHSPRGVETESQTSSTKNDSVQREWVRQLLCKYLGKYVRDFLTGRKDAVPSPITSSINLQDEENSIQSLSLNSKATGGGEDGGRKVAEQNLASMKINHLEIIEETALGDDRITYLSRILSMGVSYSVVGHPDHFVQWIVKVPSRFFDERNLARVTNVHRREVSFYVDILQDMKLWLEHNYNPVSPSDSSNLSLNVPTCYYAKYNDTDSDFDPEVYEFPNSEFTLVLEDLRAQGFGKRHFGIGLTIEEVTEAIREIAKFHATSWAMEQHTPEKKLQWKDMLRWDDLHVLYVDIIQQGFRHLRLYRHQMKNLEWMVLVDRLLELENKLAQILERLLKPLPHPAVTTLVHMDFWTDNLLFRESTDGQDDEDEEEEESRAERDRLSATESSSGVELDCMILDWQMVSLGRITHDLGILIMTSLEGGMRRRNWKLFLKFYYDLFLRISSTFKLEIPFSFSDLVNQYKDSCLLAILLSVGRMDLVISEHSTLERFFQALEDLRDEKLI